MGKEIKQYEENAPSYLPAAGNSGMLREAFRKNFRRFIKFIVVGGGSFLFSELILYAGTRVHHFIPLIALEIIAMVSSVALGFILNEMWTARKIGWHGGGISGYFLRFLMYELIYAAGNVLSITVQLYLKYFHGIPVVAGNFLGAAVATPVNYLLTMKLVWRLKLLIQ